MKIILIFLASLITVYCVGCANGCSGHGTCSSERECLCFRQQGLGLNDGDFEDFGWTGADCSQRMCPEGLSFASQSYQNVIPWFSVGTKIYKAKLADGDELTNDADLTAGSYKQIIIEDNLSELILAGAGGRAICYDENMGYIANIDVYKAELQGTETHIIGIPTSFSVKITGNDEKEKDGKVNEQLKNISYCRIPYIRKDLSLFTFFTLSITNDERIDKEKPTWKRTLKGKAIHDVLVYMSKTPTKRSVDIACRNAKTAETKGQTITVYTVQIETAVDKDEIIMTIDQSDYISGSCSFLYSPFTQDSISLKDSEIYNLIGSEKYFGYQIENGVLLWVNNSKNTDFSIYDGNFTLTSKTFTNVNFTGITKDRPTKSEGEIKQVLQNGIEISIISFGVNEPKDDNSEIQCDYITEMTFSTIKSVKNFDNGTYTIEVTPHPYINRKVDEKDGKAHFLPVGLLISNVGPHAYVECSGAGLCNRNTGKCECYEGHYGSACQRLVCPNNCNNRGKCITALEYFGGKEDINYGDSILPVCKCDGGYRGIDCSQIECPSTADPNGATNIDETTEFRDCSGRGICDYSSGKCECFKGYGGSACDSLLSTY